VARTTALQVMPTISPVRMSSPKAPCSLSSLRTIFQI
jgi:hypothetical protein